MTRNDKQPENEVIPVKHKSRPKSYFCYVCRQWFFMTVEDFSAHGHYTEQAVQQLAERSAEHRAIFLHDLKPPDKPKPMRQ